LRTKGFYIPSNNEQINVISAESQIVAGTNYKVTIDVANYKNVVIQYFIALPVNDASQTPQDLKVIDFGAMQTGSYQMVDSQQLVEVKNDINSVQDQIRSLLKSEGIDINDDAKIDVISAQSQVVAGTNYRVTLKVGDRQNVVIGYYVALPVDDKRQSPSNVKLESYTSLSVENNASETTDGGLPSYAWIMIAVFCALLVIAGIVCLTVHRKGNKNKAKNPLYTELSKGGGNDTIGASLI